jgi:hypothetical protein
MSQMLAELILQFSALCFCSSKREEKKPKKKKREKNGFQQVGWQMSAHSS